MSMHPNDQGGPDATVFELPPSETEAVPADAHETATIIEPELAALPEDADAEQERSQGASTNLEKATREKANERSSRDLSLRKGPEGTPVARHANVRRTAHFAKLMALTFLANLLVLGAAILWLKRHLSPGGEPREESASPAPSELKQVDDGSKEKLAAVEAKTNGLLNRVAGIEEQSSRQSARLDEIAKGAVSNKSPRARDENLNARNVTTAAQSPSLPGIDLPAAGAELVQLRERNRLTGYADEAIATGARAPYEKLQQAIDDPRMANLLHAAQAEILRVQAYYLATSRIEHFDIPVGTYFPDDSALKDTQLKQAQLMKLLRDKQNPWEVRMKAANLLGRRRSLEAGDALLAAVKDDENLDVVKEAALSFEEITGVRARIFDVVAMEEWWAKFKATPTPLKPKPNTKSMKGTSSDGQAREGKSPASKSGPGK